MICYVNGWPAARDGKHGASTVYNHGPPGSSETGVESRKMKETAQKNRAKRRKQRANPRLKVW